MNWYPRALSGAFQACRKHISGISEKRHAFLEMTLFYSICKYVVLLRLFCKHQIETERKTIFETGRTSS